MTPIPGDSSPIHSVSLRFQIKALTICKCFCAGQTSRKLSATIAASKEPAQEPMYMPPAPTHCLIFLQPSSPRGCSCPTMACPPPPGITKTS